MGVEELDDCGLLSYSKNLNPRQPEPGESCNYRVAYIVTEKMIEGNK